MKFRTIEKKRESFPSKEFTNESLKRSATVCPLEPFSLSRFPLSAIPSLKEVATFRIRRKDR